MEEGVPPVPRTWTIEEVANWARGCDLPDGIVEMLLAEEVDGATLLSFESKKDVKDSLGVSLGKAAKLWDRIVEIATTPAAPACGGMQEDRAMILVPQAAGTEVYTHADSLLRSSWAKVELYSRRDTHRGHIEPSILVATYPAKLLCYSAIGSLYH